MNIETTLFPPVPGFESSPSTPAQPETSDLQATRSSLIQQEVSHKITGPQPNPTPSLSSTTVPSSLRPETQSMDKISTLQCAVFSDPSIKKQVFDNIRTIYSQVILKAAQNAVVELEQGLHNPDSDIDSLLIASNSVTLLMRKLEAATTKEDFAAGSPLNKRPLAAVDGSSSTETQRPTQLQKMDNNVVKAGMPPEVPDRVSSAAIGFTTRKLHIPKEDEFIITNPAPNKVEFTIIIPSDLLSLNQSHTVPFELHPFFCMGLEWKLNFYNIYGNRHMRLSLLNASTSSDYVVRFGFYCENFKGNTPDERWGVFHRVSDDSKIQTRGGFPAKNYEAKRRLPTPCGSWYCEYLPWDLRNWNELKNKGDLTIKGFMEIIN